MNTQKSKVCDHLYLMIFGPSQRGMQHQDQDRDGYQGFGIEHEPDLKRFQLS